MAAHLSALIAVAGLPFGHVVGPLVVYLIKATRFGVRGGARAGIAQLSDHGFHRGDSWGHRRGRRDARLRRQPRGSGMYPNLERGITFGVFWIAIVMAVLLLLLFSLIFIIAGTIAASQGRPYTYPFAIRFLR